MKCFIIVGFLMFFFFEGNAQNLVPNPSFEDTLNCPTGPGQIQRALGWNAFRESPDYFNSCASNSSYYSVPSNGLGYQQAASGNAYVGMICYNTNVFSREITANNLITPLTIGQKYFITFMVNSADDTYVVGYIINKIGVKFSTTTYTNISINNSAHIFANSLISDTSNWTKISGSFVADSAYNYIMLGNFFDDNNTMVVNTGIGFLAYYYVDDVCVSTDSLYCETWTNLSEIENTKFEVYPNPASDYITIKAKDIQTLKFFDITRRLQKELFYQSENIDISDLSIGIYLVEIRDRKNIFYKKIIKN